MLAQKPEGLALARELGLGDRLVPTNREHRNVYILHGGRLHPLPDGMMLAVPDEGRALPAQQSLLVAGQAADGARPRDSGPPGRRRRVDRVLPAPAFRAAGRRSPRRALCWRGSTPETPSGSRCSPPSRASESSSRSTAAWCAGCGRRCAAAAAGRDPARGLLLAARRAARAGGRARAAHAARGDLDAARGAQRHARRRAATRSRSTVASGCAPSA